ncbi:DUF1254 domain-containing protein [Parvibaculum sp.]|uniref:DUF1254 domain-containing protein n=1 Tax=Parvibaculum sp. TaxID=2024848 RepID=UPI000C8D2021|nr:DUF1254 domain-containing protein [Parvibaculum sp.]MAB14971.1 hypothetical protein [Parvibaculum sp.]
MNDTVAASPLDADMAQEIAVDAYIYAFPLVVAEISRRVLTNVRPDRGGNSLQVSAPMNRFAHMRQFPDDSFSAVVRPNADTLYSALWFDVSEEPLVISVPDSGGRYYLLPMMDMWTHVFAAPGSRTTGTHAQTFAIVGPDWQGDLPSGVKAYRAPTPVGWMIGRTQTNGVEDYEAVRAFQAGIEAVPLSAWGGAAYEPPAPAFDPELDMTAPSDQVFAMDAATFFGLFAKLLRRNPPHVDDHPMLDRLARIGLVPGQGLDMESLSPEVRAAIEAAPALGREKIGVAMFRTGNLVNGWRLIAHPMGTYGTDYMRRAVIAYFGLGAVPVEDAVYPSAWTQEDGNPFDSATKYVMHFEPEQIPPARAFWSLTMYNEKQLFAANPIDRFAIGDRDKLHFNADGSLDLYIQRDQPSEPERQANWLPAPASGSFSMNLRVYWPKPDVLDGIWAPPPVTRLD